MDTEGYPTDEELRKIRDWPYQDCGGLLRFVGAQCWAYPERYKQRGRLFHLSTGGWSGNEEVISALQDNVMFWALCWRSSRRGGAYSFEVPEINMGDAALPPPPDAKMPEKVEPGDGWRLLEEGEPLLPGDGYRHPDYPGVWIDYACRPAIFRGSGTEGSSYFVPQRDYAHTWPWRRRLEGAKDVAPER